MTTSAPKERPKPDKVQSKIGMINEAGASIDSDATVIHFASGPARDYVAVGLRMSEGALHTLALALDNAVIAQHS